MTLDRRQFARAASSGIALFAIPGWFAACQRARHSEMTALAPDERPLLLLNVVDDQRQREVLGEVFGIFLLHAADEELALLATCDIACATTAEIEGMGLDVAAVHAVLQVPGEPALAVVQGKFPFTSYDPYAPHNEETAVEAFSGDGNEWVLSRVAANHAWIAAQLARALGMGSKAFELGLARDVAAHGPHPDGVTPTHERAVATPCLAFERASAKPEQRREWLRLLAEQVRDRWSVLGPPGSSWLTLSGCGGTLEPPPPVPSWGPGLRFPALAMQCGLGFVHPIASRFLSFYCETGQYWMRVGRG